MRCLVLALAGLVGCACGESADPAPAWSATASAPLAEEGCERVFSPASELRLAALAATERWSRATGCDITVGEGGTPILLVDDLPRPDGSQAPGSTEIDRSVLRVHARAVSRARVVMHELGHGLGGEHVESMGVLSGTEGHTDAIDTAALTSVCLKLPCMIMAPEAP